MTKRRSATPWIAASLAGGTLVIAMAVLGWRLFHGPDPLARGISAYRKGEWSDAQALARQRLQAEKSDPIALRLLARSTARLDRDEAAEGLYRRLGTDRMEAEDLFLLGRGLLRRGGAGPALAALRAARDLDPDHAETLDALAARYAEMGQVHEGIEAASRLSRQPGWESRLSLRDPVGAADALREALDLDPQLRGANLKPAEASKLLASALLQCGRPDDAERSLARIDGAGSTPETAWLRSRILLQQGKNAEAQAALKDAGTFGESDPMRPEPATYAGAGECAVCHAQQYDAHQKSRHAATFVKTAEIKTIPWPDRPVIDLTNPEVRHAFHRSDRGVEVVTSVAGREFRALIEYALGSNHQGQSFLARDGAVTLRELRMSRYPAPPIWDRANQHPERPPDDAGYLGRPLPLASETACLGCHVTNSAAATHPAGRPEAADRGIGCERCHGPGGNHLPAVEAHFPDPAIARPRLAGAEQVMKLCGDCHKAPPGSPIDKPDFIRFQTPNLLLSRCYTESGGGMSCVTCHDPHRDAVSSATHYERICLSCHASAAGAKGQSTDTPRHPPCPVNPTAKCLECHMPRSSDAVPRATFTDHFIRVRRDRP